MLSWKLFHNRDQSVRGSVGGTFNESRRVVGSDCIDEKEARSVVEGSK